MSETSTEFDFSSLGIVACPGGSPFATLLISQLETLSNQEYARKVRYLMKDFDISRDEAERAISIQKTLNSHPPDFLNRTQKTPHLLINCAFTRFANGEFKSEILESVRSRNIFVVQDVGNCEPVAFADGQIKSLSVNDLIMNLYVTIDALQQAKPKSINLVLPLYPYSRQHKRNGREGLTSSSVGRVFENMGVEKIITLDIHSRSTENSFQHMGLENLKASYQIIKKLWNIIDLKNDDLVVLAPDTGSLERNKFYAVALHKPLAVLYKERDYSRVSQNAKDSNIVATRLLGDVKDKIVLIPDDMLGTGGTLISTMRLMKEMGARQIICAISLPLFNNNAVDHFDDAYKEGLFHRLIGTDAINLNEKIYQREWFVLASVVKLFASAITNLHLNRSISQLMDNRPIVHQLMRRKTKEFLAKEQLNIFEDEENGL